MELRISRRYLSSLAASREQRRLRWRCSSIRPLLHRKRNNRIDVKIFRSLDERLDQYLRKKPTLGKDVYIARGAVVVGDVTLGDGASIWYNAVLRGDINRIVVGDHSNVQDNAVLHLADDFPCLLGQYVTVGHSAVVHACTVGDECLIGMGAVILDGAELGEQCLVGARALVTQHSKIPPGSLVLGAPAKVVRSL